MGQWNIAHALRQPSQERAAVLCQDRASDSRTSIVECGPVSGAAVLQRFNTDVGDFHHRRKFQ